MKTLFISHYGLGVFLLFLLAACGGGASNADVTEDVFIPNVSNQWLSSRGTTFFFNPERTGVNESAFDGFEQDTITFENLEFTGKFKNYDIEFTFTSGPDSAIKYTGKFLKGSNPLKMRVTGTNNVTLEITQNL
jgi:hypothetical protein